MTRGRLTLTLSYAAGLHGSVTISRHHYQRHEKFEVLGSNGAIVVSPGHYSRYSRDGKVLSEIHESRSKSEITAEMVDSYLRICQDPSAVAAHLTHHLSVVTLMQGVYASAQRPSENMRRTYPPSSNRTRSDGNASKTIPLPMGGPGSGTAPAAHC